MKAFGVAIAGLLMAAPVLAQASDGNSDANRPQPSTATTDEAAPSGEQQAEDDSERRICRRIEENTGSRTSGRRVCMTPQQWRNYNARF